MDRLRSVFFNPPRGGNEHGVPTANPMVVPRPTVQPHIGANFVAGAESAREGRNSIADPYATEHRNFGRGRDLERVAVHVRPGDMAYEAERNLAYAAQVEATLQAPPPNPPHATIEPKEVPARMPYRTDGKPLDGSMRPVLSPAELLQAAAEQAFEGGVSGAATRDRMR